MFSASKRMKFFVSPVNLGASSARVILSFLFFFSGCAALIYQVIWQRMLFTIFGVDLESVTIIVSVFMFGLGVGALIGGVLADRFTTRLLSLYIGIELGVAIFGFLSPEIITTMGAALASSSEFVTALACFFILAIPTILMGATFPILVTHVYAVDKNIGRSVGGLYFFNTLGGALGAYFAGFVLLYSMDLYGAVARAADINLVIALVALLIFRGRK